MIGSRDTMNYQTHNRRQMNNETTLHNLTCIGEVVDWLEDRITYMPKQLVNDCSVQWCGVSAGFDLTFEGCELTSKDFALIAGYILEAEQQARFIAMFKGETNE